MHRESLIGGMSMNRTVGHLTACRQPRHQTRRYKGSKGRWSEARMAPVTIITKSSETGGIRPASEEEAAIGQTHHRRQGLGNVIQAVAHARCASAIGSGIRWRHSTSSVGGLNITGEFGERGSRSFSWEFPIRERWRLAASCTRGQCGWALPLSHKFRFEKAIETLPNQQNG
jgi:hypothetical protein